jgi:hypothetical protein
MHGEHTGQAERSKGALTRHAHADSYHGDHVWTATDAQKQKRAVAEYLDALDAEAKRQAQAESDNDSGTDDEGEPRVQAERQLPERKAPKVISPSDPASAWTAKANKRVLRRLRYFFEDCVLDTDRRELRRGVDAVPMTPQAFDLLDYLIRNRERVVSKDDLIAAIWEGRVVSDAALTTRINVARGAIGCVGVIVARHELADFRSPALRLASPQGPQRGRSGQAF